MNNEVAPPGSGGATHVLQPDEVGHQPSMQPIIPAVHRIALASRSWPGALRYLITVAVVIATAWAHLKWGDAGQQRYPFLVFIPVIFGCGALLDRGNGFLATILSAALCAYYFLPPLHSFGVASTEDQIALLTFTLIGLLIAAVVEALHAGLVALAQEHELVRASMKDRELLLEELAHRTRNDFANVVTLLNLQSRTASGEARESLLAAADRVQTIARVHRRLELYGEHVVVDTKSYINELCADLRLSRLALRPIAIECTAESHLISVDKAVPLGLIINESITNAAKHAFRDQQNGVISVSFVRQRDVYKLTIADNGVGIDAGGTSPGALGNRLMQMLAAQLGSDLEIVPRSPGTAVVVTMAVKTARKGQRPDQARSAGKD